MSSARELLELAERCEREEPSRELDFDIGDAVTGGHSPGTRRYTSSLDAAVTLVPEQFLQHAWMQDSMQKIGEWVVVFRCDGLVATGNAKTEPMARCAASLRARAALTEQIKASKDEAKQP